MTSTHPSSPEPGPPLPRRYGPLSILAIAVALLAGLLVALALLNYGGVCVAQLRTLSDDEFIDAAIGDLIRKQRSVVVTRPSDPPVARERPYVSVAQFKELNPDCCRIVPHNHAVEVQQVALRHRLWGAAARTVSITYVRNITDVDGATKSATTTAQPVVGNCGRVLNLGF